MRAFLKYVFVVLAVFVTLSSCSREGKVIPRGKLSKIYAEMFVADQMIQQDPALRRMADTSWVYEPIFRKYGYTSDDYRASMEYYIQDPDRYARILRESGVILEDGLKALKKEKEKQESLMKIREEISDFRPERIYCLTGLGNRGLLMEDSLSFFVDSAGGELFFDVRDWMDTLYSGPAMVRPEVPDTAYANAPADTSAASAARDSSSRVMSVAPRLSQKSEPLKNEKNFSKISVRP